MAVDSQNHMVSSVLNKHLPFMGRSLRDASEEPRSVQVIERSHSISSNGKISSNVAELSIRASSARSVPEEINGIALNVAGILCKWVNYGKGWRPRWFVLQDGVLSYYKVHGPNKITVNLEQRGFHVVGDASIGYLKRHRDANTGSHLQRAVGELHLKVSSIWKNPADDTKFYIFTGTKTLNLRAFTREDRRIWLDSLQAAQNLFLKIPVTLEINLPLEGKTVSTKALRSHLIEEGMSDAAIIKCEKIMISEFKEFQDQLKLLQHNYITIFEKLKLMEAGKIELETTVVDKHLEEQDRSRTLGYEKDGGTTDLEDIQKHGADSDDDNDVYFDTNEFFSYHQNTTTDSLGNLSDLDDALAKPKYGLDSSIDLIGFKCPYVKRRKKLPEPEEQEKGVSLWSLIKENIGKDLTKVCLPVYFNEPISSLQNFFEDLEYSYLLD